MVSFTCQADLEAKILSLQRELADRDERDEILAWDLNRCRQEKAELEHKYQQLYDLQFEAKKDTEVCRHSNDDILREEIDALEKEVTSYRRQALIWQDLSRKYQVATSDLQDQLSSLRSEASIVANIKAQRDSLEAEHAIAVGKISQLEMKLEEDLVLYERLRTAEQSEQATNSKLGDVTASKILLELEISALRKKLETCAGQHAEMEEVIKKLEAERNALRTHVKDTRTTMQDCEDEEGSKWITLADELMNYKESYHQMQKELAEQKMMYEVLKSDSEQEAGTYRRKIDLLKSDAAAVRHAFEGLQVELEAQRELYDELSTAYNNEVERCKAVSRKLKDDTATLKGCHIEQDLKEQRELHAVELDSYKKRLEKLKGGCEAQEAQLASKSEETEGLKRTVIQLTEEKDKCKRTIALLERDLRKQDEKHKKYQEGTKAKLSQFQNQYQKARLKSKSQVAHIATHVDSLQPALKAY
eukprot:TRINITY_DN1336_c0_g1_i2.p1 TRINITY_DN1336_c0_g1~~TRINITY_DN1336_c0_g1_i2.p1  ORF type:complete len:474 (+),score=134.43 TRINITY_DN1336_c0_g1_i2:917-2338(+)